MMIFGRLNYVILTLFLVLVMTGTVYAASVVYESFVSTESSKIALTGAHAGGQFGAAMSSGDFNGDRRADLFVGAPFTSVRKKEWNGAVKVIFGGTLANGGNREIGFYGEESGDQFGTSVVAGDFNGDSISDLAVGAHNAVSSTSRSGKVYIIYGGQNVTPGTAKQLELTGLRDKDGFGLALKVLDINNDNIDDLLVGAPFADTLDIEDAGSVYGYFGSVDGLSSFQNVLFMGQSSGERFGSAMSGGDINNDGITDVVFSAYASDSGDLKQAGKVYIYKGKEAGLLGGDGPHTVVDTYDEVLAGGFDYAWFGFALAVGNLDADNKDDLAVSYFPYKGDRARSGVSVFMGDDDAISDVVIKDPINDSLLGASVLLKDLDGDFKGEIIVGAPGIGDARSPDEGDVYIFYSQNARYAPTYSIAANNVGTVINGESPDDWFGYSLEALDFNGDGLKDLAVGSRYSDGENSVNNGKVFILFNRGKFFGEARAVLRGEDSKVTRGELVDVVLGSLKIKKSRSDEIANCHAHLDFCLFNFMAMSSYSDIKLEPDIVLYPDVPADHLYADAINTATMLEIVNGYMSDTSSPFHPDKTVSRIEALKVVLGAADLVEPKHKFEMIEILGSYKALLNQPSYFDDVDSRIAQMWWYPRYTNFAVDQGIIDREDYFRPHDNVTAEELLDMVERTLAIIDTGDEEAGA